MLTCPVCKSAQLEGTIFCSSCGASFLTPTSHQENTSSLGVSVRADVAQVVPAPAEPVANRAVAAGRLVLLVLNSGRRLSLDVGEDLLIGRKDHTRGIFPDIDLGLEGGFDAGVSRRHAIVMQRDGRYYLEDLGSANGSFINGRQVEAQQQVALQHGDELQLGSLLLRVEIE